MKQEPGSWKVIRVNGSVEERAGKPTLDEIQKAIGCDCIDCVTLDHETQTLMAVESRSILKRHDSTKKSAFSRSRAKP